jgi:hypothetical protein
MSNSNAMRVLLGAMLCCASIVAAVSDGALRIRVGGAEPRGPNHFVVAAPATISVAVQGHPGDKLWLYAEGPSGETTLFLGRSETGLAYGDFRIPRGTEGCFYKIRARSESPEGKFSEAEPILLEVMKSDVTDPVRK